MGPVEAEKSNEILHGSCKCRGQVINVHQLENKHTASSHLCHRTPQHQADTRWACLLSGLAEILSVLVEEAIFGSADGQVHTIG